MKKLHWHTETRVINDLVPYERNPRTLSDTQLRNLKKSLEKFNLVEIPAIDIDGKIIAGHQRLKVMQLLDRGQEEIDVRVPNRKLTKKEYEQYLITSNKVTGDWDFETLKSFDLGLLTDSGFEDVELAEFWDEGLEAKDEDFDPEEELKEIKTTDIELGDLLIMGKHKLLCADATDTEAVQKLFGDEHTSMIYSDPPYNIDLDYNKGVGSNANYGGQVDDNKPTDEYKVFIEKTLKAALSVSHKNTHIFYWCDEAWVWLFQTLYSELKIKNRRLNIWLKNNASPTPTVAFNKAIEFCVYGTKGSPYLAKHYTNATEIMNAEMDVGNDLLNTVDNVWTAKRIKISEYEHPTSKPPSLHEKVIKRCTKPGDIILDSFAGSGSTLICADSLDRRVYYLEAEPIFCELVKRRYEALTSSKAELIKHFYEKA